MSLRRKSSLTYYLAIALFLSACQCRTLDPKQCAGALPVKQPLLPTKEDEGPFPWRHLTTADGPSNPKPVSADTPCVTNVNLPAMDPPNCFALDDQTAQADLKQAQEEASAVGCIAFKLPAWNALAGRVVDHAVQVIETLFRKHEPLIYKVGVTHSPAWRWCNPIYGYSAARDKWSNMLVFHCSPEPYGPSMLEAALIDKYKGVLPIHFKIFFPSQDCLNVILFFGCSAVPMLVSWWWCRWLYLCCHRLTVWNPIQNCKPHILSRTRDQTDSLKPDSDLKSTHFCQSQISNRQFETRFRSENQISPRTIGRTDSLKPDSDLQTILFLDTEIEPTVWNPIQDCKTYIFLEQAIEPTDWNLVYRFENQILFPELQIKRQFETRFAS